MVASAQAWIVLETEQGLGHPVPPLASATSVSGLYDWRVEPGNDIAPARFVVRKYPSKRALKPGEIFCTLYYTPKESGFTAGRGFDVTPETRPGLGGRRYPLDFLKAVRKEGFGRMAEPVRGRHYLQYNGHGRYGFARHVLGNRGNPLKPRISCAVNTKAGVFPRRGKIRINDRFVEFVFENESGVWEVADTGGGIKPNQIDLYWGEDDPRGPGRHAARPAGTDFEFAFDVKVDR